MRDQMDDDNTETFRFLRGFCVVVDICRAFIYKRRLFIIRLSHTNNHMIMINRQSLLVVDDLQRSTKLVKDDKKVAGKKV